MVIVTVTVTDRVTVRVTVRDTDKYNVTEDKNKSLSMIDDVEMMIVSTSRLFLPVYRSTTYIETYITNRYSHTYTYISLSLSLSHALSFSKFWRFRLGVVCSIVLVIVDHT